MSCFRIETIHTFTTSGILVSSRPWNSCTPHHGILACGNVWSCIRMRAFFLQVAFEAAARGILACHIMEFLHAATFGLVFACRPSFYQWHSKQRTMGFLHATSWNSRIRQHLVLYPHAGLVSASSIWSSCPWNSLTPRHGIPACGNVWSSCFCMGALTLSMAF